MTVSLLSRGLIFYSFVGKRKLVLILIKIEHIYIYANFPKIQSCVSSKVKTTIKNINTVEEDEMLRSKINTT